ncbi:MAG: hypothetical protein JSV51_00780 [Candidatus Bathyarchaeota archaeon]|nr:MAG: hypothetical protein JSV51_00780 [Candidatus Bathyarchaeota archaeon]
MPKRRTRYEIYAELLDLVSRKGFSRVTRASYGANLPVDRAKETLSFLATRGFLREDNLDDSVIYRITSRGREYLETFRHMRKLFAALDKESLSRQAQSPEPAELISQEDITLSLSKKDVKVNEDFSLEIKLNNRGNSPITLKRIDGISSTDFKVVDKPTNIHLKEGYLDTSRMIIHPKKPAEMMLTLCPSRAGSLLLKLRIMYSDQTDREFVLEAEQLAINVVGDETFRVGTGLKDLDKLLLGGIPDRYSVILTSAPCDERDLLTSRFLREGIQKDEVTFYLTIDANILKHYTGQIKPNLHLFLFNPQADSISKYFPNDSKLKTIDNLTDITITLTSAFRKINRPPEIPRRAYIEILSDILLQHGAARTRKWLAGILITLKSKGFTSLVLLNPQMHSAEEVQAVLDPFEGEIDIYQRETNGATQKYLRIRRMLNQRYLENEMLLEKEKLRL